MIYTDVDPYAPQGRTIIGAWGHPVNAESAKDDYVRLEDRIDRLIRALETTHETVARRRLRKQIDRYDAELTRLHQALYPAVQNTDDVIESDVVSCRSVNCTDQLTRQVAFQTAGFCPPCWQIATGKAS